MNGLRIGGGCFAGRGEAGEVRRSEVGSVGWENFSERALDALDVAFLFGCVVYVRGPLGTAGLTF